jgi:beta-mannosidase
MDKMQLNGIWEMSVSGGPGTLGRIPGSVYSIMLGNGLLADPFYRGNELAAFQLMENDFTFSRTFHVPAAIRACPRILLHFDGLDTLSRIFVNDFLVGTADNFHRVWEYNVAKYLFEGENFLRVEIASPLRHIRQKDAAWHVGGAKDAVRGFPHLRKPHCMFGWDWGPRLPDAGIWRDVTLIGLDKSRISDIRIFQDHEPEGVRLTVSVEQEPYAGQGANSPPLDVCVTVTSPEGQAWQLANREPFTIPDSNLWWPNGLGGQPLYLVQADLVCGGRVIDTASRRIGLRTMSILREKDQWGESFAHCVNGITYFAMGADYIPEDNILARITPERTRKLLEQCAAANFNTIRVWGGGYYPGDDFFDVCDELGLVVWQDFMFSCANYPLDDDFEVSITAEIRDNVRRIRHHACLGLWCGNNEMEMFAAQGHYDGNEVTRAHYIRIFEHIIPHVLKQEDAATYYWPASPSSGGSFFKPNDPDMGDVHYWEVWHGGLPFSEYRKFFFRYVSEFGFQSFPCLKTVESFTLPEDRNIFSRVMEMHQRNPGANGKIMQYLAKTYLYPGDFSTLLYASQLLQAEAVKYGVEHWRRNRGRCMGAIYWQLNDIWPVASWSSIDYFGRWKALHYYARRFFTPVMISCEENCETTIRGSVVEEPSANISTARLNVTNESRTGWTGLVEWSLRDAQSHVLADGREMVLVPALSSAWLDELDFSATSYLDNHFTYRLVRENQVVSAGSVLFTAPKHYHFADPKLSAIILDGKIKVTAQAFAKSVEITSTDEGLLLDDNYFDMEAGTIEVAILEGNPQTVQLRSVFDIRS